jgi:hypothetical protein
MKLKDTLPYCLKPFSASFNPLYFWVIGGFTYSIDSLESYCPPDVFDEHIHLSRYNFCNHDDIQKKYNPDNNLTLNLNNEITIFDKFILVHKTRNQTTNSESKLFYKTHYYVANEHDFSSDSYAIGLYHTDALGGMATNLRTVFKDLIDQPVQPKSAELTLDEKLDDLVDEIMKDSRSIAIKELKRMLNERR